jgi:hypothetical protein
MGHTVQRVAAPARTTAAFSDAGACPPFVKSELDVASPENDTGTRFDIDESHPVSDRSLPWCSERTVPVSSRETNFIPRPVRYVA